MFRWIEGMRMVAEFKEEELLELLEVGEAWFQVRWRGGLEG